MAKKEKIVCESCGDGDEELMYYLEGKRYCPWCIITELACHGTIRIEGDKIII
jgi:late competence protein required for DNA uptake (superfamily II DNA/RNA helicase)